MTTNAMVVAALTALSGAGLLAARPRPARRPVARPAPAGRWSPPGQAAALLRDLGLNPDTAWLPVVGGAAAVVSVLALADGPLLAAAAAGGLAATPRMLRPALLRRAARRRDEQLVQALERLAAELRSGRTLGPAMVHVAEHTPAPLGTELRAVAAELRHGAGVTAALRRWGEAATASAEVRLTAAALALGSEAGGQLARSVDDLASTLRERRELRAEARALATQARASAAVLAVAPPAFTLLVSTVEPGTLRFLLGSPPGLACLVGGVALDLIGGRWMARIVASAA